MGNFPTIQYTEIDLNYLKGGGWGITCQKEQDYLLITLYSIQLKQNEYQLKIYSVENLKLYLKNWNTGIGLADASVKN